MKILRWFPVLILIFSSSAFAQQRYFFSGDGKIVFKRGSKPLDNVSPRLIALLGYLQDALGKGMAKIQILSAYRSPEYNEKLRQKGKLAAKASLHQEGMAVDFTMEGVPAEEIWKFVKNLNCCGVGFYHGNAVHIDTGPPRFWDETSSKVFTDFSLHNKQIYITTQYDIYQPGEKISFDIVRITEYPFGIKMDKKCLVIASKKEAQHFIFDKKFKKREGKPQQLKMKVCQKPSPEMPDAVISNTFIIASPK